MIGAGVNVNLPSIVQQFILDTSGLDASVRNVDTGLTRVATSMGRLGSKMTTFLSLPIGAGLAAGVEKYAELEKRLNVVTVVAENGAGRFKDFEKKAIELGKALDLPGVTSLDAAMAMEQLAKAGFNAESAMMGARGALQFMVAAELDAESAADLLANTLITFNLGAEQSSRVANTLVAAANAATMDVSELATAFKYAALNAETYGLTVEETAAAIAVLSNAGLQGSTAGTQFRMMLQKLASPTEKAKKILTDMGIKTQDLAGNMLPLSTVLKQFWASFMKAPEQSQMQAYEEFFADPAAFQAIRKELNLTGEELDALNKVFEVRGGSGMRGLVLSISKAGSGVGKSYDEMVATIEGNTKAVDNVLGAMMKGINGNIEKFKNQWDTFLTNMGKAVKGPIGDILDIGTKILDWFNTLSDASQKTAGKIALFAVAAGPLIWLFSKFLKMGGAVASGMGKILSLTSRNWGAGPGGGAVGSVSALNNALNSVPSAVATASGALGGLAQQYQNVASSASAAMSPVTGKSQTSTSSRSGAAKKTSSKKSSSASSRSGGMSAADKAAERKIQSNLAALDSQSDAIFPDLLQQSKTTSVEISRILALGILQGAEEGTEFGKAQFNELAAYFRQALGGSAQQAAALLNQSLAQTQGFSRGIVQQAWLKASVPMAGEPGAGQAFPGGFSGLQKEVAFQAAFEQIKQAVAKGAAEVDALFTQTIRNIPAKMRGVWEEAWRVATTGINGIYVKGGLDGIDKMLARAVKEEPLIRAAMAGQESLANYWNTIFSDKSSAGKAAVRFARSQRALIESVMQVELSGSGMLGYGQLNRLFNPGMYDMKQALPKVAPPLEQSMKGMGDLTNSQKIALQIAERYRAKIDQIVVELADAQRAGTLTFDQIAKAQEKVVGQMTRANAELSNLGLSQAEAQRIVARETKILQGALGQTIQMTSDLGAKTGQVALQEIADHQAVELAIQKKTQEQILYNQVLGKRGVLDVLPTSVPVDTARLQREAAAGATLTAQKLEAEMLESATKSTLALEMVSEELREITTVAASISAPGMDALWYDAERAFLKMEQLKKSFQTASFAPELMTSSLNDVNLKMEQLYGTSFNLRKMLSELISPQAAYLVDNYQLSFSDFFEFVTAGTGKVQAAINALGTEVEEEARHIARVVHQATAALSSAGVQAPSMGFGQVMASQQWLWDEFIYNSQNARKVFADAMASASYSASQLSLPLSEVNEQLRITQGDSAVLTKTMKGVVPPEAIKLLNSTTLTLQDLIEFLTTGQGAFANLAQAAQLSAAGQDKAARAMLTSAQRANIDPILGHLGDSAKKAAPQTKALATQTAAVATSAGQAAPQLQKASIWTRKFGKSAQTSARSGAALQTALMGMMMVGPMTSGPLGDMLTQVSMFGMVGSMLGPWGALISVIIGGIVAILSHWEEFRSFLSTLWAPMEYGAKQSMERIGKFFSQISHWVSVAARSVADFVSLYLRNIGTFIVSLVATVGRVIKGIVSLVATLFVAMGKGFWNVIKGATSLTATLAATIAKGVVGAANWTANAIVEGVGSALSYLAKDAAAFWQWFTSGLASAGRGISGAFSSAFRMVQNDLAAFGRSWSEHWKSFGADVYDVGADIYEGLKGAWSNALSGLSNFGSSWSRFWQNIGSRAYESVRSIGSTIVKEVAGLGARLYNAGTNMITTFASGIAKGGSRAIGSVTDFLKKIARNVIGQSPPPEGPLSSIDKGGQNIMQAWVDGMANASLRPLQGALQKSRQVYLQVTRQINGDIKRAQTEAGELQRAINDVEFGYADAMFDIKSRTRDVEKNLRNWQRTADAFKDKYQKVIDDLERQIAALDDVETPAERSERNRLNLIKNELQRQIVLAGQNDTLRAGLESKMEMVNVDLELLDLEIERRRLINETAKIPLEEQLKKTRQEQEAGLKPIQDQIDLFEDQRDELQFQLQLIEDIIEAETRRHRKRMEQIEREIQLLQDAADLADSQKGDEDTTGDLKGDFPTEPDSAPPVQAEQKEVKYPEDKLDWKKESLAIAKEMKLTQAEQKSVEAYLRNMQRGGVKGTTAAKGMRQILLALKNPEGRKELARLGVTIRDVNGKMLPLSKIMSNITERNLDAAEAFGAFGREGGQAIVGLTRRAEWMNGETKKIKDIWDEIDRMAKASASSWDKFTNRGTGNLENLKKRWDTNTEALLNGLPRLFQKSAEEFHGNVITDAMKDAFETATKASAPFIDRMTTSQRDRFVRQFSGISDVVAQNFNKWQPKTQESYVRAFADLEGFRDKARQIINQTSIDGVSSSGLQVEDAIAKTNEILSNAAQKLRDAMSLPGAEARERIKQIREETITELAKTAPEMALRAAQTKEEFTKVWDTLPEAVQKRIRDISPGIVEASKNLPTEAEAVGTDIKEGFLLPFNDLGESAYTIGVDAGAEFVRGAETAEKGASEAGDKIGRSLYESIISWLTGDFFDLGGWLYDSILGINDKNPEGASREGQDAKKRRERVDKEYDKTRERVEGRDKTPRTLEEKYEAAKQRVNDQTKSIADIARENLKRLGPEAEAEAGKVPGALTSGLQPAVDVAAEKAKEIAGAAQLPPNELPENARAETGKVSNAIRSGMQAVANIARQKSSEISNAATSGLSSIPGTTLLKTAAFETALSFGMDDVAATAAIKALATDMALRNNFGGFDGDMRDKLNRANWHLVVLLDEAAAKARENGGKIPAELRTRLQEAVREFENMRAGAKKVMDDMANDTQKGGMKVAGNFIGGFADKWFGSPISKAEKEMIAARKRMPEIWKGDVIGGAGGALAQSFWNEFDNNWVAGTDTDAVRSKGEAMGQALTDGLNNGFEGLNDKALSFEMMRAVSTASAEVATDYTVRATAVNTLPSDRFVQGAAAAQRGPEQPPVIHNTVNLNVDKMEVRNDQDIVEISRQLEELLRRQDRFRGSARV